MIVDLFLSHALDNFKTPSGLRHTALRRFRHSSLLPTTVISNTPESNRFVEKRFVRERFFFFDGGGAVEDNNGTLVG